MRRTNGIDDVAFFRSQALGALPYAYPYPAYVPDHHLSVAAAAAAAAGKRSREDGAEICRDYLSGKCSRGKNCKYVHYDPYGVAVQRKPTIEVCLDFQRGTCTRGLECKYLHVQSPQAAGALLGGEGNGVGAKRSTEICKDFNRGLCTRGDSCRYLHVTIPTINQQTQGLNSPQQHAAAIVPPMTGVLSPVGSSQHAVGEEMTKKPKVEDAGTAEGNELTRLRAENQSLRLANQNLEDEVAQLRAQLGLPPSVNYGYGSHSAQHTDSAMDAHANLI